MLRSGNPCTSDEKGFEAYLCTQRKLTLKEVRASVDPNREHTLRCDFADYLAEKEANGPCSVRRETLCAKKYVSLDQYRDSVDSGLFTRVAKMSKAEKKQQFGSSVVPIYVPLARDETAQQYEERFLQWLQDAKKVTLQDLMNRWNWREERYYRIQFASANAAGEVQFSARKPDTKCELFIDDTQSDNVEAPLHKKRMNETEEETAIHSTEPEAEPGSCDSDSPVPTVVTPERGDGACKGYDSMAACLACGCKYCLQSGLRFLASQVSVVQRERERSPDTEGADAITQLVRDKPAVDALTRELRIMHPIENEQLLENQDPMESKLLAEYDAINDEIVLNEKVLDTAVARLAALSTWDIQQITALQDENQDLRELIQGEYGRRNVALARVILYLWRQDTDDLHENDPGSNSD